MSDTPNATGTDDATGNEPNVKALRDAAEQGRKDRAENERLKRELALAKAGVDTTSPVGKLFAKAWDGDPEDIDALKVEWAAVQPAGSTTTPTDTPTPPGFQDPAGQQQHREGVTATGTPAGDAAPETKDPRDLAYERFNADRGQPMEDRQEGAVSTLLEAYFNGDRRVMFDRNGYRDKAMQASAGDGAQ